MGEHVYTASYAAGDIFAGAEDELPACPAGFHWVVRDIPNTYEYTGYAVGNTHLGYPDGTAMGNATGVPAKAGDAVAKHAGVRYSIAELIIAELYRPAAAYPCPFVWHNTRLGRAGFWPEKCA